MHTIPPLPQSVEMKNVNDGLQGEKTTSDKRSKTVAVLSGKKGVQQQSDTPTLSSSSTDTTRTTTTTNTTTDKEPQAVQQQTDNAAQDVQMKDGENKSQGEKSTSTKSSKTVSSSSSTTDKAPEAIQQQSDVVTQAVAQKQSEKVVGGTHNVEMNGVVNDRVQKGGFKSTKVTAKEKKAAVSPSATKRRKAP